MAQGRLARRQQEEMNCKVVLEQMGEAMTLFTKPTSNIIFYTNRQRTEHKQSYKYDSYVNHKSVVQDTISFHFPCYDL